MCLHSLQYVAASVSWLAVLLNKAWLAEPLVRGWKGRLAGTCLPLRPARVRLAGLLTALAPCRWRVHRRRHHAPAAAPAALRALGGRVTAGGLPQPWRAAALPRDTGGHAAVCDHKRKGEPRSLDHSCFDWRMRLGLKILWVMDPDIKEAYA